MRVSILVPFLCAATVGAVDTMSHAGVASNVLVCSDQVEDVSSIDAWERATLKPGMSGEQKALAIYDAVLKFGHFDPPPMEMSTLDGPTPRDAIKLFNVYGYSSEATSMAMLQLARHAGLPARSWTVNRWGFVPEVQYDGSWHAFDPTMTCYFRTAKGGVAGVEELRAGVKAWYEENPGFLGEHDKIRATIKDGGIAKGPEVLRNCPGMDERGNFIFNYFGWYTAMMLYDGSNKTPFPYEESYSEGYRVNNQLRPGEVLTRNWSNKGLHINMDGDGGVPETLAATVGSGVLYFSSKLGDRANGRIGNGTLVYQMPATDAGFQAGVLASDNIIGGATIHAKDPIKLASFVVRMPCSYVYLSGSLAFTAAGDVTVEFSDNHGADWRVVAKAAAGAQVLDLKPFVFRHYDYRLRITLNGAGASISPPLFTHDIQHSQRALPALGQGANTITFNAGANEGTITIEGAGEKSTGKQPTLADYHAQIVGMDPEALKNGLIIPSATGSTLTFPIETPGDMKRIRFGCSFRAGSEGEGWDLQVSYDDGKSFATVGRAAGPTRQNATFITYETIPTKTRKALVRFSAVTKGNTILFRPRIDADYSEPHGAFAPIKVTYRWEENGQAKEDIHIATKAKDTYTISCTTTPKMTAIILEQAP